MTAVRYVLAAVVPLVILEALYRLGIWTPENFKRWFG